jgi:hypothetical protein
MLVKELIEILQEFDPDTQIIIAKDPEGNGYSPGSSYFTGYYIPDTTYSGEVYCEDWTAEDCDMDEDQWEEMRRDNPVSVILVPTN